MTTLSPAESALLAAPLPPLREALLPGGRVLTYREAGPAAAPAILLLHGIGSSSAGYRAQLAGLADQYRLVAWNAPGFGGSTPLPERDAQVDDYVAAATALLDALGIAKLAVLMGSSWGSVIAANLAAAHPGRVGALLLAAPNTALGHLPDADRADAIATRRRQGHPDSTTDRAAVADRLLTPETPAEIRALVERLRDALTAAGWEAAVHMLFTTSMPEVIARVTCPVTLLAGTRDQIAPLAQHAARLKSAQPTADLRVLEGYGHMLKLEAPAYVNALLRDLAKTA
jgi:pimeloyl-ACP methyl ester carboxylesterase